ncbi:MAG: lytic murein transglycosylase [Pseudomonadota bacterium]
MTFDDWKADFLTRSGFPAELADWLVHLPAPTKADATQVEARKTLKQYLDLTVSQARIAKGQAFLAKMDFSQIKAHHDVDPALLLAIWGMETNFGAVLGDVAVFGALATLAAQGRRRAMFEDQLMAAADMVDQGIDPATLVGSWAGAIGHTQFMPRSWIRFAQTAGDDLPDLIGRPMDAMLSSAGYLAAHGAQSNQPWGGTATGPLTGTLEKARHADAMPLAGWKALGVHAAVPDGMYRFILPAGVDGPGFLVTGTYDAVLAYNHADAYALAVCHLADRIKGGPAWDGPWPTDTRALSVTEMAALQSALTKLGFDTQGADGFTGPNTIKAIEAYQRAQGLPVDGFAGVALLGRLVG